MYCCVFYIMIFPEDPVEKKEKVLVIVLGETRAWEQTYNNFHENVIAPLSADLCVCIGVKRMYDYNNSYYKNAKYRFIYDEPDDWADAFNYAESDNDEKTANEMHERYEMFENSNATFGKLKKFHENTDNCHFLGRFPSLDVVLRNRKIKSKNYEEIVYHEPNFIFPDWRYCAYGIVKSDYEVSPEYQPQYAVTTLRRRKLMVHSDDNDSMLWRKFLTIKNQFMGGIYDDENQHPGSAGILIFLRWFLWKNLKSSGIINEYDRFIITRSDYIWRLSHPEMSVLSPDKIWVPNCESYGGITDRHTVIPRKYMEDYCGILSAMISPEKSDDYYNKLRARNEEGEVFNLEKIIVFHLRECGITDDYIDYFPYVMFSIRPVDVSSRWSMGHIYREDLKSYIKYVSEYDCSQRFVDYLLEWRQDKEDQILTISDFYRDCIGNITKE